MSRLRVVLCRPIYPRNVGMCARALANMDVERLIVIGARTSLGVKARQGAAHAQSVLRSRAEYATFDEFLADEGEGIRIALSGREGDLNKPRFLDDLLTGFRADPSHQFARADVPIYLLLGPEDDGLSNEEMDHCHHVCRLPTFGPITSLNLSHACLLTVYLVQSALGRRAGDAAVEVPVVDKPAYYPSKTIHAWLDALGFDLSSPRVNIEKTLNRIFLSQTPSADELRIVDSVLQQTVRKLRGSQG